MAYPAYEAYPQLHRSLSYGQQYGYPRGDYAAYDQPMAAITPGVYGEVRMLVPTFQPSIDSSVRRIPKPPTLFMPHNAQLVNTVSVGNLLRRDTMLIQVICSIR